jgi:hypothetical protein
LGNNEPQGRDVADLSRNFLGNNELQGCDVADLSRNFLGNNELQGCDVADLSLVKDVFRCKLHQHNTSTN